MIRAIQGFLWSLLVLATLIAGYTLHVRDHLNLSGDEVHFVFQGLRQWSGGDEHLYAESLSRLQHADAHVPPEDRGNYESAVRYLKLQRLYYEEYVLPKVMWAGVTRAVDSMERVKPVYSVPGFVAQSAFWSALAGIALVGFASTAAMALFNRTAKLAFALALVVILARDSSGVGLALEQWLASAEAAGVLLRSLASSNKDLMAFGLSPRSLFLMLTIPLLLAVWSARESGKRGALAHAVIPLLGLIHATSALLLVGVLMLSEVLAFLRWRVLPRPTVLFFYALTLAFVARSGSLLAGMLQITIYLLALAIAVVAAMRASRTESLPARQATGPRWALDTLAAVLVAAAYLLLALLLSNEAIGAESYWRLTLVGERLGTVVAAVIVTGISYWIARWISDQMEGWGRLSKHPAAFTIVLGTAAGASTLLAASTQPIQVFEAAHSRLASHSRDVAHGARGTVTFVGNNSLHLIWYGVIASMLSGTDQVVEFTPPEEEAP